MKPERPWVSRADFDLYVAKFRARIERAVHETDVKHGRDVATAVRDKILFFWDEEMARTREMLWPEDRHED